MKNFIFIITGFLVSVLVVACGSSESTESNNVVVQCPAGTSFQGGYCVNPNGTVVHTGSVGFYSENYRERNLKTTGNFTDFLRDAMGVCDRGHINGGGASCSLWATGAFDVVIQAPTSQTNTLQATFRAARPRTNTYGDYYYSLPSLGQVAGAMLGFPVVGTAGAYLPKLQLNMTVSVTNNYKGFEARGYGDFYSKANRSLIQIQIPEGKLEDGYFSYRIAYRGEAMATGQFVRCSTADCRVNEPIGY